MAKKILAWAVNKIKNLAAKRSIIKNYSKKIAKAAKDLFRRKKKKSKKSKAVLIKIIFSWKSFYALCIIIIVISVLHEYNIIK